MPLRPGLLLPLLPLLAACPGKDDDTGDTAPPITCEDPVVLEDANNYAFSGTLDIAETEVQAWSEEAPVDYRIDWSAITQDLQGHPVDPAADIDTVTLVAFPALTPVEIEGLLATNALQQSDIGGYAFAAVDGVTEIQVSQLTLLGNDIDIETYLTLGSATWMVLLSSGSTPGVGTRLLHFLLPSDATTNTEVLFTDTSTVLDYSVDLASLTPAGVPAGAATIDWSAITEDGRDDPIDLQDIDTVKVAWFESTEFTALAGDFLDVELNADKLWSASITEGSSVDLSTLEGPEPFPGVGAGTWALALQCSTCSNPAPLVFTQLLPCE